MPFVQYHLLHHLSPAAFKLYVFLLDLIQDNKTSTFSIPMVELGYRSGLQPPCIYPAFRHGKDGQLRKALSELINANFIEKSGQRGRAPNTYTLRQHHLHTNPFSSQEDYLTQS